MSEKIILKRRRRILVNKNDGVKEYAVGTVLVMPTNTEEEKFELRSLLAGNNVAEVYKGNVEHLHVDEAYAKLHEVKSEDVKQSHRDKQTAVFEELTKAIAKLTEVNEKILEKLGLTDLVEAEEGADVKKGGKKS